jgi:hypothetical protein
VRKLEEPKFKETEPMKSKAPAEPATYLEDLTVGEDLLRPARDRVVFIRAPRRLTAAQLTTALGSMAEDDPRWLAVHQVIDEALAFAMLEVSAPVARNRDHAAGRVDELATLKQRLLSERKAT